MASFCVGTLFSTYEELKARIDEYQSRNSLNLTVKYSKSIEANRNKSNTRKLNEALKYHELCFACPDCERYKSWNKSVNNVEMDSVNVRVVATKDGEHLEIRRMNEKHNHPTGISKSSPGKKNILADEIPRSSPKRKRNIKSLDQPDSINLGKQTERWKSLKEHLNVFSDEDFAEVLLNRLEQEIRTQTSRKVKPVSTPFLSGVQLSSTSSMTTSTPYGIKREQGTVQVNEHPPVKQEREYFSDLVEINDENHKYKHSLGPVYGQQGQGRQYFSDQHKINYEKHSTVSDQQEREFFSDLHGNNDEKYKHNLVSPTLSQSEMKPQFITYMSEHDESSPFQMSQREIKPLHECSNDIYQYNSNGERSTIKVPIIDLGKQYDRWEDLKQKLHIETDEGMAMFLIDHQ